MTEPSPAVRGLLNPADPPERQQRKLMAIVEVLMRRVEQDTDRSGAAYAQFERAAVLEDEIRERTGDLDAALRLLNDSNARLSAANRATETARRDLADAIETVQEGFGLFSPDDILVLANSRFGLQIDDIRPALVPGLSFAAYVEKVSTSDRLVLPEGVSPQDWALQRLRRHHQDAEIFTVELTGDRWLQVSERRTGAGGTVILQTDVTDILRAERAARGRLLDDQARVIRATLDHISQGVCIFDAQARIIGWNDRAARLLAIDRRRFQPGVAFEAMIGRLADKLRPESAARIDELLAWVAQDPPRMPLRFDLRRGNDVVLDMFAEEMPDRGFVLSVADVSAERRAISALSRANETLEANVSARTLELGRALADAERANATRARFVAAASHDLLQPLSAAKLFLASMHDDTLPPRALGALTQAQSALESVDQILETLLDISRLETGRLSTRSEPVALAPLLDRLAREFAPMAAAEGLRFKVRTTSASVISDPTWLRRILQNLIGNALRYTRRGGVLVGVRHGAHGLRVEIADTGPGIPENEREAIFREFHRLNARASAAEGLGLGLAIVERAAALLGYTVTLDSRLGHGSRFVLHLGAASSTASDAAPAGSAAPSAAPLASRITLDRPPHPGPRPTLNPDLIGLLVASDLEIRRALSHLLETWGVNVLDVPDAAEAMALIDEIGLPPDFLLIDAPPGTDDAALDLVRTLRARHGPVPARILSASRAEPVRLRAQRLETALLAKPVDSRQIEGFIADIHPQR